MGITYNNILHKKNENHFYLQLQASVAVQKDLEVMTETLAWG